MARLSHVTEMFLQQSAHILGMDYRSCVTVCILTIQQHKTSKPDLIFGVNMDANLLIKCYNIQIISLLVKF